MAEDSTSATSKRAFGQMGTQPPAAQYSDADVQKIVQQALQQAGVATSQPAQVPEDVPEEDKALVAEVQRIHPGARNVVVTDKTPLVGDLSHARVSYSLTTGAGVQNAGFLVFDDGKGVHVFRSF